MITIRTMSNISCIKEERKLPMNFIEFLEERFKELHEAHAPEVDINQFSLEMYGPIFVLEKGLDNLVDPSKIGLCPEKNSIMGYRPEWVERINLSDRRYWWIGVMADNDYLFQVIIPTDEFSFVIDHWLREYLYDDELLTYSYSIRNDKTEAD